MNSSGEDFVNFLKRRYPNGNKKLETELRNLKRKIEGKNDFICPVCAVHFTRKDNMQRHIRRLHANDSSQSGGGTAAVVNIKHRSSDSVALDGLANNHYIFPEVEDRYDIFVFMANIKPEAEEHLKLRCVKERHIKYYMNLQVEMRRQTAEGEEEVSKPHFRSKMASALNPEDIDDHALNVGMQKIFASFDEYVKRGSSWTLKKIILFEIHTAKYVPIGGTRYCEIPTAIKNSQSVINIQNTDEKCFIWSVLASLYPQEHNAHRVSHYQPYETYFNMDNISFPVHPSNVPRFEKLNNISVNVFGYEEKTAYPIYISNFRNADHHVDLLYICDESTSHWCLIKNFDRFMNHVQRKGGYVFCKYCLQGFTSTPVLRKHVQHCSKVDAQCISYPTRGKDDKLTFDEWNKKMRIPFVIYADFETFCEPIDSCTQNKAKSFTENIQRYEPCGFGYQVVCTDNTYTKDPVIYRGPEVGKKFLEEIINEKNKIDEILKTIKPLRMSVEQENCFQDSTHCHICTSAFTENSVKVRDHCHLSGKYRGAACQSCNLNFQHPSFVPVVFHNLKHFDSHIICNALGIFKDHEINCIAQNSERYVSFSLGNLRFIDSFQFLGSSLETLVHILASDEGASKFQQFNHAFPNPVINDLLLRKGIYCYEFVDKPEKFERTSLPPIECFYSHLTGDTISQKEYEHAQKVWTTLNLQTLGEYHDLYLKTDILLLADVFENFRDSILEYFHLDPCYYYTAPGLSWSACFRMTKCSLTLLSDPDMYLFFEQLRGGVSMISNKYAKANNPEVKDYDTTLPHTWIQYLDCNSLYAHTMTMELPTGGFRWLTDDEIRSFNIMSIPPSGSKGYVLEVDIDYPDHLHNDHSDLPVAPEQIIVDDDQLSPYSKALFNKVHSEAILSHKNKPKLSGENVNRMRTKKLVPNLNDKKNYVLHFRNLQQYLNLGLVLKKVHRIIEFDQSAWIAPYIHFCAEKRRLSKSKSQSQFFKLLPNSFFGKTCEDLRKRINFKLVHNERKFLKEVAKSSFKGFTIFSEDLVGLEHAKVRLHLNKPIYTGFCVLDMSKTIIYDFHYFKMKPRYPGPKLKLLWTDTDSLGYLIQTQNVYEDMMQDLSLYDTSNYPKDHFLYSLINERKPGVMKDESPHDIISEYVGLRSKMYAFVCNKGQEVKIAKGVKKNTIASFLRFEQYKACLFDETFKMCSNHSIRSEKHTLFLCHVNKIGLSAADDKRYVLDNKHETLAIGHYITRI